MTMSQRFPLLIAIAAMSLILGPVPIAAAADTPHEASPERAGQSNAELSTLPEDETQPERPLEPKGREPTKNNSDGGVSTQGAVGTGSPHDCWGRSNNPHVSDRAATRGDIKGFAETWCNFGAVEYVYVSASLWEKRWWGYDRMTKWFANDNFWDDYEGVSAHYDGCKNNRWRLSGYHEVTDSGVDYSGSTANYEDITC